ncbi:MAG: alpha-glucan family phosphorylase [Patescibacteria group bacterium]
MNLPTIAYISMEFGLEDSMKTFCGGLGILSGDIFKSATDLEYNFVGFSILYKNGYFKQLIRNNEQIEQKDNWDYASQLQLINKVYEIEINREIIKYQIWTYQYESSYSKKINKVYFIDTDIEGNSNLTKSINDRIYPSDSKLWLLQESILGLISLKINNDLNLGIDIFHLNESHGYSLCLGLMDQFQDIDIVKSKHVFTTHTPLEGAHQKVEISKLEEIIDQKYTKHIPKHLIKSNQINFTDLVMFYSKRSNAVAKRHQEVTTKMYKEHDIKYITNGVHINTWVCEGLGKIYDQYLKNWRLDPNALRQVGVIPDQLLIDNHQRNKENLSQYLILNGYEFDSNVFTIGFARRTTGYKRADLILTQIDRLKSIAKKYGKLQIVFSGKAYPTDKEGKELIKKLNQATLLSDENLRIIFIPNYGMDIAKKIILGCDLWLNNPLPPLEASGTSGMKASLNGIPNFSILDGWWVEGHLEGETGWSIGNDLCLGDQCKLIEIEELYSKLEYNIYETWKDKQLWSKLIKTCIALNGTYFNTHRVVQEYFLLSYLK